MQHDTDGRQDYPLLDATRKMLVARVLLRTLEKIGSKDSDQEWVDLYNLLKPLCEASLRSGRRRPGSGGA